MLPMEPMTKEAFAPPLEPTTREFYPGHDRCFGSGGDQRAFVPFGTQTGVYPLDPHAAGPYPKSRAFAVSAAALPTNGHLRPLEPRPGFRPRR